MLDGEHDRFFLGRKARDAGEAYIFARYHMYRSVYFHKTVRAAEVMLRLLLQRFKALVDRKKNETSRRSMVPNAPPHVVDAFTGKLSFEAYMSLDESSLTEFFKACAIADDEVLRSLGGGLIERKLFKAIDVTDSDSTRVADFVEKARNVVRKGQFDPDFAFVHETAADTPYKPYDPDESKPASQIYIEAPGGNNVEISTRSDALRELRKQYKLVRYYFPETVRERIEKVATETLTKERGS